MCNIKDRHVLKPEAPKRNRRNETTGTTAATETTGTTETKLLEPPEQPETQFKGVKNTYHSLSKGTSPPGSSCRHNFNAPPLLGDKR